MSESIEKLKQIASLLKCINSNRAEFSPTMLTALQGVESIAFQGVKNAKPTHENVMLENFRSGEDAVTAAINYWQWCNDSGGSFENNIYIAFHEDVEQRISCFVDDLLGHLLPKAKEHLQQGDDTEQRLRYVAVAGMLRLVDREMQQWIKACPDLVEGQSDNFGPF